jgi:hypothetical protein
LRKLAESPISEKIAKLGHLVHAWCGSVLCIKNKIEEVDLRPGGLSPPAKPPPKDLVTDQVKSPHQNRYGIAFSIFVLWEDRFSKTAVSLSAALSYFSPATENASTNLSTSVSARTY